ICSTTVTNALGASDTITITHPLVTARAVSATEFSGLYTISRLDQMATNTGSGTSATSSATSTTLQWVELLIGAIGVQGGDDDSFAAGSGYTSLPRVGSGTGAAT